MFQKAFTRIFNICVAFCMLVGSAGSPTDAYSKESENQLEGQFQPMDYEHQYEWTGSQAITDNNCAGTHQFITLNVPDTFTVTDLKVGFNATHPRRSDVRLWVISPNAGRVELMNGSNGGTADNFDVLFKTSGISFYAGDHNVATPFYENAWAPQVGTLTAYNGLAANGNWKIEFCDDASSSTGTIHRWALFFNQYTPQPDIEVDPLSVTRSSGAPGTANAQITIYNHGDLPLDFEIHESTASLAAQSASLLASMEGAVRLARLDGAGEVQVEEQLRAQMALDPFTSYLIYFHARPDLTPALYMNWKERGQFTVKQLQEAAEISQARVRSYLETQKVEYKAYWIDNVIIVKASNRTVFEGLQSFTEIEILRARRHPNFYEPVDMGELMAAAPMLVQSNLTHVGADQVWASGITGQGIVVANIDTGVNYTHEALIQQYRGNLGGGAFNHNHNWYDPASGGTHLLAPADWHDHGSHTMGTMVGSTNPAHPATATNTIGMAPGAEWIACRAFEETDQELLDCGQFMAAPTNLDGATDPQPDLRPHIINNSWGDCTTTYDPWYDGVLNSWHALGIYPVFSNGNAGNCGYPSPPGLNSVGSPARAGNVTGVGATGRNNGIYATFSNWGPTDQFDMINAWGYPQLKPQVVAPGTNYSAASTGNDYMDMSGTSMSAPHVAGLIALVWSAAPCLVGDYANTETILQETATPIAYASGGTPPPGPGNVPNYATGWGEINANAAVESAQNFCAADPLPWVTETPITGTVDVASNMAIQLDFTCTLLDAQQPQPLQGWLHILHNDPSQAPVEVALELYCIEDAIVPVWDKNLWINDIPIADLPGPHVVRPGDIVRVVDAVGAMSDNPVTGALTQTWGASLRLLTYDTGGVGLVTQGANELIWRISGVAANVQHPMTTTFEVSYGTWNVDTLLEQYSVEGEISHLADKPVIFNQYVPEVLLEKEGPDLAGTGDTIPVTLTITTSGSMYSPLWMTDTLPAGLNFAGNLQASYGTAWESGGTVYWTGGNTASANLVQDGGFEGGTPNLYWVEASTNFGTPLCDNSCGGPPAHSGDWFAWFGGTTALETGSLQQSITIPPASGATLSFWLLIGANDGSDGYMNVKVDGVTLFSVTQADAANYASYTLVEVDVSDYADGGAYLLSFESTTQAGVVLNFFVDDVVLVTAEPLPTLIEVSFDALVTGLPGSVIDNYAQLDWGTDNTEAWHRVLVPSHSQYLPMIVGSTTAFSSAAPPQTEKGAARNLASLLLTIGVAFLQIYRLYMRR